MINSIEDLAMLYGVPVSGLKRALYKYTACGAWIEWTKRSVTIGSIVEGSDAEFSKRFEFPVTVEEIDDWLEELEELTDEAWTDANGEWD